jgi:CheY-like chemotaxis protein
MMNMTCQLPPEELQEAGFIAGTAADGVKAVLQVIGGGWDAVLMDIRMPKLDGINALKIIRRIAPHLPVIMFTGQAARVTCSNRPGWARLPVW